MNGNSDKPKLIRDLAHDFLTAIHAQGNETDAVDIAMGALLRINGTLQTENEQLHTLIEELSAEIRAVPVAEIGLLVNNMGYTHHVVAIQQWLAGNELWRKIDPSQRQL